MKDLTLYHLFKMQPNALLIRQNFIVCKKRVLHVATPLPMFSGNRPIPQPN
jgi:hypothetical protein